MDMGREVSEVSVKLQVETKRDGTQWLARCPAIDVVTQARTKSGALDCLKEAVQLWFESCIERKVLSEALEECGFGQRQTSPTGPVNEVRMKTIHSASTNKGMFSVAHHQGMSFIDGFIPACIASQQLRDMSLARS